MRGFEQIPWLYDAMQAAFERGGLIRWRRWLVAGARGRTLDVGSGTGRNLPLYPPGVRVVGVEPHPQNLAAARRRAPRAVLVQARAEALPFRDGAFETVVSGLVFCSIPEPPKGLAEIRRVLGPKGALRMLEHVRSTSPIWSRVQDAIQPAWTLLAGGCHPNRDTERMVEQAGFRIEEEGRRARNNMRRFQARPV
jgi:ubiquinone/menaquinone biosynthesis C-methylase UbiE